MKANKKLIAALSVATLALAGCYVVPAVGPDGRPVYHAYPIPPGSPAPGPYPVVLTARLYPANDLATQTGVVTGSVTNMMTGKGRFQLNYRGETLTGEATRVNGDARRGVASAYGSGGAYMSCEYQMNTPQQGAGICTFSDGAKYQVHIGS
ncbi:MAG: hypothetical protein HYS35_07760 [Betaproteobacteria bacterium]|nr:hypothetical protein [Betaproteobacteria bacterium]